MTRVDVAVLGATLPGLCVARWLTGAKVAVIGPRPPEGIGLVPLGLGEHFWRTAAAVGEERTREILAFSGVGRELLAGLVPLSRTGGWWAGDDRELPDLERDLALLERLGVRAELRELPGFARGLWLPDEACVDAGLDGPVVDARVLAVEDGAVRTDRGTIRADVVVFASDPPDAFFEDKLTPVREQALQARGGSLPPGRTGQGWTSFRPVDGGLVVAGARWATPHLEVGETEAVTVPAVQEKLEAFAARFGATEVLRRWAWITAHTCDGLPIVGPLPGSPRRIACCGFAGLDTTLGVAAARAVADGLLTGRGDVPRGFEATRF